MRDKERIHSEPAIFWVGGGTMEGNLEIRAGARAVIVLAWASASRRKRQSSRLILDQLHAAGLATFAVDLLTEDEEQIDSRTERYRQDVVFLAKRLITATQWLTSSGPAAQLPVGYLVSGIVSAAAFLAAERLGDRVKAIVSAAGVPDLAIPLFPRLPIPTLLMVEEDSVLLVSRNREAFKQLRGPRSLILLSEDRDLRAVAGLAADWFERYLPIREADAKGAVESQMQPVEDPVGDEALGYTGTAHEEHTGEPVVLAK